MLPGGAPPVLLTRPAQASAEVGRQLCAEGVRVIISPLLEICDERALPPLPDALLLTSANGVAAYERLGGPPGLPVWCVGTKTAARAAGAGLQVRGVAETAAQLATLVPLDAPPLIHLRGAVQRGDLAAALRARGLLARDAVIYAQHPVPLSRDAQLALERPVIVPLYSPRTAALFVAACPEVAWPNVHPVALSHAVAEVLPVSATIALRPDGAAMLNAIIALLRGSAVEGGAGSL